MARLPEGLRHPWVECLNHRWLSVPFEVLALWDQPTRLVRRTGDHISGDPLFVACDDSCWLRYIFFFVRGAPSRLPPPPSPPNYSRTRIARALTETPLLTKPEYIVETSSTMIAFAPSTRAFSFKAGIASSRVSF